MHSFSPPFTMHNSPRSMPRAFFVLLGVQFVSTLADNAFLIVAIARVIELAEADWRIPLLKIGFTLFYVLLAPLVGPIADAYPKGRVMVLSNGFKVLAMGLLLYGVDPLLAIVVAGWGAALYAPAKYGLMTELLRPALLVRANGYFEGATVCAVIFGTVLGGLLISPLMPELHWPATWVLHGTESSALVAGMLVLFALNTLALLVSFAIPDSGARYDPHSLHPWALVIRFWRENILLWRDSVGGMSLAATTLLWGVGATMQLLVLRWANEALGLPLDQAAYLQGTTALGVVAGAITASRYVALEQAVRLLPLGLLMGLVVPLMLLVESVPMAAALMVVVGAMAGFFVVPMNALLQHRGYTLLTAGRSIAVQGFNENAGMLVMLAVYAGATALQLRLSTLVLGFGALVTVGMGMACFAYRGQWLAARTN
ncbi:MAG: lysophospholipid transporter LplT [Curvibacter sp.]|nr:MAG: lysophospholipid transporter LplT [Curvibacter sp.]